MPGRARVLEAPARRGWASQPSPQHSLSSQPSCAPQAFALCRPGQSLRFRRQEDPAPGQGSLVLSDAAKLSSVGFTAPTRMSHPNTHTTQKRSQAEYFIWHLNAHEGGELAPSPPPSSPSFQPQQSSHSAFFLVAVAQASQVPAPHLGGQRPFGFCTHGSPQLSQLPSLGRTLARSEECATVRALMSQAGGGGFQKWWRCCGERQCWSRLHRCGRGSARSLARGIPRPQRRYQGTGSR